MTNQKRQNSSTEQGRDAYGGRLRQGILPFLLNEFVYSPFSMIKPQSSLVHHQENCQGSKLKPDKSKSVHNDAELMNLENYQPSSTIDSTCSAKRGPGRPRKELNEISISTSVKKLQDLTPGIVPTNHQLALPIKRKPGRPPGTNVSKEEKKNHDNSFIRGDAGILNTVPLKRKRGRPPKCLSVQTRGVIPPKRGKPSVVTEGSQLDVSVRRGPGRPPRSTLVNDQVTYTRPAIQLKDRPTSPFKVRVEALSNDADRKSMVEIFKRWFPKIKVGLFREFIQPQQNQCTRRRQTFNGPFHWLIRNVESNEILCAASGMIHSRQFCHSFMEILYFATTASHLNLGLGRLLNAALQKFAYNADCEYVFVQASREAVAFWTKPGIGYMSISRELMAKFKHFYEMRSIQLSDTVLLTWTVDEPHQKIADAKKRLSTLVQLDGEI